jgi:hypothetical protein
MENESAVPVTASEAVTAAYGACQSEALVKAVARVYVHVPAADGVQALSPPTMKNTTAGSGC